ncbi:MULTISPECIES: hypothetical protein [Burkholderia]|uniref:hypothetical protein n=1 Tax=Burkholderia TaxID=32008 RepID=UPI0015886165|nr:MULTISPECIES: hypothetical protein [Burkholderia]MBJ9682687.1 hypothetical protein [Burkholderia multivorans]
MQKRVTPFSLSGVSVRHSLRHDVARHASDQRNEAGTNDCREKRRGPRTAKLASTTAIAAPVDPPRLGSGIGACPALLLPEIRPVIPTTWFDADSSARVAAIRASSARRCDSGASADARAFIPDSP